MNAYIRDLDAALREAGQPIVLRRTTGTGEGVSVDVDVLALTRRRSDPNEVASNLTADDFKVIISPTEIMQSGWPVVSSTISVCPFNPNENLPRRGDTVIMNGQIYHVMSVDPLWALGTVVRIEMLVTGGSSA